MSKLWVFSLLLLITLAIDYVWIGWLANSFYLNAFAPIGRIQAGKFELILWAAFIVYFLMTTAVFVFVVLAADDPLLLTFCKGALLGCCIYGVYDFTNFATLKDWPLQLALIDWAWGTVLGGLMGVAGRLMYRAMN